MPALVFLLLGVLCGIISRGLLIKAAFGISKKWGFGVFFPFGPLFFRISYPDEARRARLFQLATLPCIFLYVITSPEMLPSTQVGLVRMGPPGRQHYALAAGSYFLKLPGFGREAAAPNQPSVEERRAANDLEFQRLRRLSEDLRIRKRDLLNSDTKGAMVYNQMANDYNAALDKYNDEKFSLTLLSNTTAVAVRPERR
jgi:hypothetical protein